MKARTACIAAYLTLSALLAGCGSDDDGGVVAVPSKGADICSQLNNTERLRYSLGFVVDSPRQENPPDDATVRGQWSLQPSQSSFRLETNYAGTFVQPDRFDYELSTPDQTAVRGIRIGDNQWFLLGSVWVPQTDPTPFPFTPSNFCDAIIAPLDLAGKTGVAEKVDDMDAQHIRIEGAAISPAAKVLGENSDFGRLSTLWDVDLWLRNKDARLVKLQAVAKAKYPYGRDLSSTMSLGLQSFNDDNIDDINPPIF